jgi:hypothetical protein
MAPGARGVGFPIEGPCLDALAIAADKRQEHPRLPDANTDPARKVDGIFVIADFVPCLWHNTCTTKKIHQ